MVSVIIPAYNAEKYIERCIDSVCNQTYKDIQIIAIDDGSEDKTYELIRQRALSDSRIVPLHKENGGVSSARNYAFNKVDGEYSFFLDADDVLEQNAIEVLVRNIEGKTVDWVACQYSRWDSEGNRLNDYDFITGRLDFSTDEEKVTFLLNELLPYHVGYEVWNKLFRTSIIRNNGLLFSEDCRIGEDLAFNIKYLMNADNLLCIEDRCARYTIRSDSAMGGLKDLSDKIDESILMLRDVWDYLCANDRKEFYDSFALISAKVMDNTYYGKTPVEVTEALKGVDNIDFLLNLYKDYSKKKTDILSVYSESDAKMKYRYHMYVLTFLTGFSMKDRVKLIIYDAYRILRKRQILEKWVMPY